MCEVVLNVYVVFQSQVSCLEKSEPVPASSNIIEDEVCRFLSITVTDVPENAHDRTGKRLDEVAEGEVR